MKMTNINSVRLKELAKEVCSLLNGQAVLDAKRDKRHLYAVISAVFRGFIKQQIDPKTIAAMVDNRESQWKVKLFFWDVTEGNDRGELIAETDPETVRGFHGVTALILEYATMVHPELDIATLRPFSVENLAKRMGGIRPAISKGGGSATTKIQYQVGAKYFNCIASVSRAEKPLDITV